VVDVGNSKTCALLFENPNDIRFNLSKVKHLKIMDLTDPTKSYEKSFSTRLIFMRPDFGNQISELNQYKKFKWPSMVRIGDEAERLINNSDLDKCIRLETKSYNSSPKRYLWDVEPSNVDWNFMELQNDVPESVYLNGISEQLKSDGTLCTDGVFGTNARYSRRTLMTFVFLEILSHAQCQINSYEFRSSHGNTNSKRRIKRILISCPTAMIKEEQKALRQCANEAVILFNNFNKVISNQYKNLLFDNKNVDIIPEIKDLRLDEDKLEAKDDWMRDTALEWVKVSFDAVEITVTNGIFTAEEIKPLIFMHLTRMFNIEERLMGTAYEEAGYVLKRLEDKGYLTTREVDTFLNSVFLMRSDVKAYFNETELS
ncbi:MAG: hypothetical protein EB127_30600, partial [Alphaproteobacteria bacterium]|nr:hypothetical protein [Alphaproteobacteria bacterium]